MQTTYQKLFRIIGDSECNEIFKSSQTFKKYGNKVPIFWKGEWDLM